ncbi:MAG: hypothetical protein DLM68_15860 [Hyphomicrobiales bacterium]|nr:MAG: hypothetical protein DLM68_15860 [Hyphomicrobiales bacterium]
MQWATNIKKLLKDGLYVHNLRRIEDVAWEAVKNGQSPCPAYVIFQISRGIADCWDDGPLLVTEAKRVEDALRPSIEAVLVV